MYCSVPCLSFFPGEFTEQYFFLGCSVDHPTSYKVTSHKLPVTLLVFTCCFWKHILKTILEYFVTFNAECSVIAELWWKLHIKCMTMMTSPIFCKLLAKNTPISSQTMNGGWRGSVVRTSVFGWRIFPNLWLIYGWHTTASWVKWLIWVDMGQPSIPPGCVDE